MAYDLWYLISADLPLVLEEDSHRLCLGNWNSLQISALDTILVSKDTVELTQEALLNLSEPLNPI